MGAKSSPIISTRDGKTQFSQAVDEAWTVKDASGNIVVQVGRRNDGTYGIDTAKPGYSVGTATPSQLSMSSSFDQLRVVASGSVTVTRTGGNDSGYVDVPVPTGGGAFLAYAYRTDSTPAFRLQLPSFVYNTSGAQSGMIIGGYRALYDPNVGRARFFLDATSINANYAATESIVCLYFILSETLS